MKNLPILYSFRRCPYAIRARCALINAKINHIVYEVDLKNKPEKMMDVSSKGTVPVMTFSNGEFFQESIDIMVYASQITDPGDWLGGQVNYAKSMRLIDQNDYYFKPILNKYKYTENFLENSKEFYRRKGEELLEDLEKRLARTQYLLSNKVKLCDFGIFPFIRQWNGVEPDNFKNFPHLKRWLDVMSNNEIFIESMKKHKDIQTPIIFENPKEY